MHFLHLIRSLDPGSGGPAEGLRQLCLSTRRLGHATTVVTLDGPQAPWLAAFPGQVEAVGPGWGTYGYAPRLLPWLRARAGGFDAVVVHGLWQFHGLAAGWTLAERDLPLFVFPHGMLDPWFARQYPLKHLKKRAYWQLAEHRLLRTSRAVLFTTAEEARLAQQTFGALDARAEVLGFGLDLDEEAHAAATSGLLAEAWPALRGRRLVLFLGRLHPKKGCDLLLEGFARCAWLDPSLHLVMAGPDDAGWRAELERQAATLGLQDRVTWTGPLYGAMKWSAFAAADVFALPSHQENFGVSVAEALAMGVPVLVSREVNIWPGIVEDGAGFAEADSAEGVALMLARWIALGETERRAMRERARQCFAARFHIDTATQRLVDLCRPQDASPGGRQGLHVGEGLAPGQPASESPAPRLPHGSH